MPASPASPTAGATQAGQGSQTQMQGPVHAAAEATARSINRMIAVLVPLWLLAIAADLLSDPNGGPSNLVRGAFLADVLVFVFFLVVRAVVPLLVVVTASALAVGIAGPTVGDLNVFPAVLPWLIMATTLTGAVIAGLRGALAVVCVALLGGAALATGAGAPHTFLIGIVAQAIAGGLCMWAGMTTLREASIAADLAAEELETERTAEAQESARLNESRQIARILHDTVINTLGAIRALPMQDVKLVRLRCGADLETLAERAPVEPSVSSMFNRLAHRARLLGLRLTISATGAGTIPVRFSEALEGALEEALVNSAKHGPARHAQILWSWNGVSGWVEVCDDGPGFGAEHLKTGTPGSIPDRCAEAGIEVSTRDENGAVVRLQWSVPTGPTAPIESDTDDVAPMLGLAAARVGSVLALYGIYSIFVTPDVVGAVGSGIAVLIALTAVLWARRVHQGSAPANLPIWTYVAATVASTVLPGISMVGCSRIGWYWWGPLAGLCVLIAVTLIDGRGWAIALSIAGYAAAFLWILVLTPGLTSGCIWETVSILILDIGIVAAILALRRALVTQLQAASQSRRLTGDIGRARMELAIRDEVRHHEVSRALRLCRPLLAGIAAGQIDPLHPNTRERAGNAESGLRSIIALAPELGPLTSGLADQILDAGMRGVWLSTQSDALVAPGPKKVAEVLDVVGHWAGTLQRGDRGRITLLTMDGRTTLMLMGPTRTRIELPESWEQTPDDDVALLETSWVSDPAGR